VLTPENQLLEDEQAQIVAGLLDSLGESDRELIELRYWAGLSHEEIAGVTGRRSGTVRVAIHRIVRRLESQLRSDAQ
jgi:RNA polymerase sigma factor (sigma-70 family)